LLRHLIIGSCFALMLCCGPCSAQAAENSGKGKKESAYLCPSCTQSGKAFTSGKEGKCPTCQKPLQKAEVVYTCPKCKTEQTQAGNCPKCKGKLERNFVLYNKHGKLQAQGGF